MAERWGTNICVVGKTIIVPLSLCQRFFLLFALGSLKTFFFPVSIRGVARGGWGRPATRGHGWLTISWSITGGGGDSFSEILGQR